jgi:phosphate butyryltransferase
VIWVYRNFEDMRKELISRERSTISISVAHDREILETVKLIYENDFANVVMVGDESKIRSLMDEMEFDYPVEIVDCSDEHQATLEAVRLVKTNKAQVLMKGMINSSMFLRGVLDAHVGLRQGRLLSHLAAFEIPNENKLVYHSDGGMVSYPGVEEKKQIIINGLEALGKLGISNPKVAILAANEVVSPKMPATVDAAELVRMRVRGEIPTGILEGPVAMDVAASKTCAQRKNIYSKISGDVDLFIMPSIDAGNLVGKTLMHYANAKMAGVILGATNPIVMTSRAETAEGKLNSIALACLVSGRAYVHNCN